MADGYGETEQSSGLMMVDESKKLSKTSIIIWIRFPYKCKHPFIRTVVTKTFND